MAILLILKQAVAAATILTGLLALLRPNAAEKFTGLRAEGGRGVTEIRAVFGGLFIALGLAPFILGSPQIYTTLGLVYAGIGSVRAISMMLDRSVDTSNIISLVVEIICTIILVQ